MFKVGADAQLALNIEQINSMHKRVSIASLICGDELTDHSHHLGPSHPKILNNILHSNKVQPNVTRETAAPTKVVNCDGILSVKASRCWQRGATAATVGRFCFSPFLFTESTLTEVQNVIGMKWSFRNSEDLGQEDISCNNSSSANSGAPLARHDGSIVTTACDLRRQANCSSSDEQHSSVSLRHVHLLHEEENAMFNSHGTRVNTESRDARVDSRVQRRYRNASPSNFCHICQKFQKGHAYVVCANIKSGLCRKIVCKSCCFSFGWNWNEAIDSENVWCCPHCTDTCPSRAQCFTYERTNKRRRLGIMKKRNFAKRQEK